ncbi:MAG: UDP-N-acetylglucosamine--N-acetylmuramyl-(pentapeptide) pyrophosphoryl-undecaprenol N-acetylglucosamine transferase [Arenicella sp.]|jgi:UDP-N-acetylglucosamine--N-acetylmuramyl-(pentapeptide) pyrophosphoryl-undecaprenol N-acetylglucosamine transferase
MVMAGGTGGHVFPALAVAKKLRDAGAEITWLGTRNGLESKVIPANNIAIEWISIEGLRGKGALSLLLAPFKLARAMWQSAVAIRRVQPDCILGMGGFVSGPGGLVARLMGRPLIVHEQNAVAGLTNKYLAKLATRVLSGFPNVEGLPKSALWVGNPVRDTIKPKHSNASNKLNVLIIGGSQGAHSFNLKLPSVFSAIANESVSIWHQSGRGRDAEVVELYKANGVNAKVSEFIDDMAAAYAWADLLICRSGAMTIAECCAAAKPALLVPYPFSAGDHQQKNALTMVNVGAGKMILNHQIDKPEFSRELVSLLSDKAILQKMGQYAYTLHKPNALRDVVAVCQEYLDA